MPKLDNSIASLSYNREGQFLAIASSYTYQEANELLVYLLMFPLSVGITFSCSRLCLTHMFQHDSTLTGIRLHNLTFLYDNEWK